ncbi:hypothetical protein ACC668_37710, partial [Rhizobium ruizarguesonis]
AELHGLCAIRQHRHRGKQNVDTSGRQFSKPYVANAIVLIGPKSAEIKTNADMAKLTVGVAKGAAQDTQVTKNAPPRTTIRRYDG